MTYWENEYIRIRGLLPSDIEKMIEERDHNDDLGDWFCDELHPPYPKIALIQLKEQEALEMPSNNKQMFIIEDISGGTVGNVCITATDSRNGTFSYGISLAKPYRGKGYAIEALKLVLNYYFNELRYHKCNIHSYSYNSNSIAFHTKFGFQEEGCQRESIFTAGEYHDKLFYGMTDKEFNMLYTINWK